MKRKIPSRATRGRCCRIDRPTGNNPRSEKLVKVGRETLARDGERFNACEKIVGRSASLQSWYNAAIDSQVRPGDVTGKRTAQEDDSVRDLINTTDSAKRNLGNLQKSSLDLLP